MMTASDIVIELMNTLRFRRLYNDLKLAVDFEFIEGPLIRFSVDELNETSNPMMLSRIEDDEPLSTYYTQAVGLYDRFRTNSREGYVGGYMQVLYKINGVEFPLLHIPIPRSDQSGDINSLTLERMASIINQRTASSFFWWGSMQYDSSKYEEILDENGQSTQILTHVFHVSFTPDMTKFIMYHELEMLDYLVQTFMYVQTDALKSGNFSTDINKWRIIHMNYIACNDQEKFALQPTNQLPNILNTKIRNNNITLLSLECKRTLESLAPLYEESTVISYFGPFIGPVQFPYEPVHFTRAHLDQITIPKMQTAKIDDHTYAQFKFDINIHSMYTVNVLFDQFTVMRMLYYNITSSAPDNYWVNSSNLLVLRLNSTITYELYDIWDGDLVAKISLYRDKSNIGTLHDFLEPLREGAPSNTFVIHNWIVLDENTWDHVIACGMFPTGNCKVFIVSSVVASIFDFILFRLNIDSHIMNTFISLSPDIFVIESETLEVTVRDAVQDSTVLDTINRLEIPFDRDRSIIVDLNHRVIKPETPADMIILSPWLFATSRTVIDPRPGTFTTRQNGIEPRLFILPLE